MQKFSHTSIIFALIFLSEANFASAANSCRSLVSKINDVSQVETPLSSSRSQSLEHFNQRRSVEFRTDKRSPHKTWVAIENLGQRTDSFKISFMPPEMNLSVYHDSVNTHLVVETKLKVGNIFKLKQSLIPVDPIVEVSSEKVHSESVINAGLESGRQFLNDLFVSPHFFRHRSEKASAIFLFVDVNNLGWINKNFHGKKETGDLYIQEVTRVLQKITNGRGLIFRLGGDEFALMLEPMRPYDLQKLMTDISLEVKKNVHYIFRRETLQRAASFREVYKLYRQGLVSEIDYQKAQTEFKAYTAYSQEGVSLGASYVDGRSMHDIQKSAEDMALQMKLAVKMAHQQNVSKYIGETMAYEGAPKLNFMYQVPLVNYNKGPMQFTPTGFRRVSPPNHPAVQLRRQDVLNRLGSFSIVRYVSETGEVNVFAEYFDTKSEHSEKVLRIEKIEMQHTTDMIDLRDKYSKKVLSTLLKTTDNKNFIWVNLLNLGKLNYFQHKTLTGDRALKRVSEVIRSQIRTQDLAFKLMGSEFLIYANQLSPEALGQLKIRLEQALQTDPILTEIYNEQINYLTSELNQNSDSVVRQSLYQALHEVQSLKNSMRVTLKETSIGGTEITSVEDFLKSLN